MAKPMRERETTSNLSGDAPARGLTETSATTSLPRDSILGKLSETLGSVPRLLLHDTELHTGPGPLVQPGSVEMPAAGDRSAWLQLLGEIACGGMGAILKGRDTDLGRDLAVKVLLERHRDQPEMEKRPA
jgi:hypothetical protein